MKPIGEILDRMQSKRSDDATPDTSAVDDVGEAALPDEAAPQPAMTWTGGYPDDAAEEAGFDAEAHACPMCGGLGYVRREVPLGHPNFGRALVCPHRRDELIIARTSELRTAANMAALSHMTFEGFQLQPYEMSEKMLRSLRAAYDAAREFAAEPRGWLVLTGTYGSGKTHLAAAIANERLLSGRAALFIVVPDLLDHLRATYSPGSNVTYDERFEAIKNAPVLLLDDLGAQSSTPWAAEKLFQLLNYRYAAQLPTVITTNQRLEDIEERLRSRLQDGTLVRQQQILAPDFRRSGDDRLGGDLSTLRYHRDETFDSFDLRHNEFASSGDLEQAENLKMVFDAARRYAVEPRGWLVLAGSYGSGKTHLAAAIANERVAQGDAALFVVVPDLLDHLRATFSPTSPVSYDRRFEEVRSVPFLVLDDLSMESATPWAREKLFQIIDRRYAARLPTVITTSTPSDKLDERLATRIFDSSRSTVLPITVPSYRGGRRGGSSASPRRRPGGR